MADNKNIYFVARKEASKYNEALYSREGASDLLGVSVSTLADYELGITKVVPVDKVVLMADLYNSPELKRNYCKNECPIGKYLPIATKADRVECVTLRFLKDLDEDTLKLIKGILIDVSSDGKIDEKDIPELKKIVGWLDRMALTVNEFKLLEEKVIGDKHGG